MTQRFFYRFQKEYFKKRETYLLIKMVMALPLLPLDDVVAVFDHLAANQAPEVQPFLQYVNTNWMTSSTFPPSTWNHHGRTTRSNNDLEGWHRRLNYLCHEQKPSLYGTLVPTLHTEATRVGRQLQLVEDGCLQKRSRKEVSENIT